MKARPRTPPASRIPAKAAAGRPTRGDARDRPKAVLVVEDDAALRKLLGRILTGAGYQVRQAAGGRQALERLREPRPDLLIVDIMIPDIDGVALVQAIKEREDTSRIPVIFLTARSDPQSMADGLAAGARYYVTKPFSVEDLLAKVQRALSGFFAAFVAST